MSRNVSLLDQIQIASPCPSSWAQMKGDDKVRFCEHCQLHVYNLSAMTREEGQRLLNQKEGRLCATLYRRGDGTVLTTDCPVGWHAVRRRFARGFAWTGAAVILIASGILGIFGRADGVPRLRRLQPFDRICNWLSPPPVSGSVGVLLGRAVQPIASVPLTEEVGEVAPPSESVSRTLPFGSARRP